MSNQAKFSQIAKFAATLAIAFSLGGCALLGKKKPAIPEATLPTWIGKVVMVDNSYGFALVDTGAPRRVAVGTRLLSFREQSRTALLTATEEIRPPYLAVEITEGLPSLGDQVALDESLAPQVAPTPTQEAARPDAKPPRKTPGILRPFAPLFRIFKPGAQTTTRKH